MCRLFFFGILCLNTLCAQAQSEDKLYVKNADAINLIAEKYREKGKDDIEKESFKRAILEAFDNYWKNKSVKTKLKVSDFIIRNSEIESLNAEIDSIKNIEAELREKAKKLDRDQLLQQLQISKEEVDSAENLLKSKKEELASWQKKLEERETEIDDFGRSGNKLLTLLSGIRQDIDDSYQQCNGSLGEVDVDLMSRSLANFNEYKADIQSFEPSLYDSLMEKVKHIEKYMPLCESIRNALEQMGAKKFDEQTNDKLREELAKSKVALSSAQKVELKSIISALTNQKSAYNNIINGIIYDISSEDFVDIDVNKSIEFAHSYMDRDKGLIEEVNGEVVYNRYYVIFNSVLNDIRTKVSAIKTKEELDAFLVELRNKL